MGDSNRSGLDGRLRWRLQGAYEHLAGREQLLHELSDLVDVEPLIVLRGLPGVGKSQLAAHLADRATTRRATVAWLRGAEPGLTEDALALGRQVGAIAPNDPERPLEFLADWLENARDWLLVLDGVASASDLGPLLGRRPWVDGGIVLTTTDGGWFEPGVVRPIGVLESHQAARFLLDRTGESGPTSEKAASELGGFLGGLPLALRQCEGWVRSGAATLDAYARLFEERAAAMLRNGPGPLDHVGTVSVTFDLAVAGAESRQSGSRDLLRALAHLSSDPLPRHVLQSDETDSVTFEDQLRALAGVSLIELAPNTVSVHRLVRTVAREATPAAVARSSLARARHWLLQALPGNALEPENWPIYGQVVTHLEELADESLTAQTDEPDTVILLNRLATFHQSQGRYHPAQLRFNQAVAAAQSLAPDTELRLMVEGNLALLLHLIGDPQAIPMFEDVARRRRDLTDGDPVELANVLNNLGKAVGLSDPHRGSGLLREAIGLYARRYPESEWPEIQSIRHGLNNLGLTLLWSGDGDAAEDQWLRLLEQMENATADCREEIATVCGNLGVIYDARGDGGQAVRFSRRGFELTVALHGDRHPDSIQRLINFGGARRVLARQEGPAQLRSALEMHRRAATLAQELDPPLLGHWAAAANNEGLDLLDLGRPEDALAPLEEALRLRRRIAGDVADTELVRVMSNVARALLDSGDIDAAERCYLDSLRACDELRLPHDHERRGHCWVGLGEIAMRQGDPTQAIRHYETACKAFESSLGSDAAQARGARIKLQGARRSAGEQEST